MEEYFLELLDILIARENAKCALHPGMTTGTKVKIKDLKEKAVICAADGSVKILKHNHQYLYN